MNSNSVKVAWKSPSNIAIVKYWGKKSVQIPCNPSISFTLNKSFTEMHVSFAPTEKFHLEFYFEDKLNKTFAERIEKHLISLDKYMPWIKSGHFVIHSKNSFPHSAGIASSASSMSALSLCLCDIEAQLSNGPMEADDFFNRASFISRLGSGSACRSIFPKLALWGKSSIHALSSDLYAIGLGNDLNGAFQKIYDSILIIDSSEKSVSSSIGHQLMQSNPYATNRYKVANKNCIEVYNALHTGDIEKFGNILEEEALQLHALMMCSSPSFILMKPNSLIAIDKIRQFRKEKGLPVYFTLDAGPNIHLIYPDVIREPVKTFIKSELAPLCVENYWIDDQIGEGPKKISNG